MSTNISATGRGSVAAGSITGSVSTGGSQSGNGMRTFREWLEHQPYGRSISQETRKWMELAWMGACAETGKALAPADDCEFGCMPMDHGEEGLPDDLGECPGHPGQHGDH